MRYFIEISYKGTHYAGWQKQKNAISVQEKIEKALSTILKTEIHIIGSGRTDAGVHALQQFAHMDYPEPLPVSLLQSCNALLPKDIAIQNLYEVPPTAHSRFSAIERTYQYYIIHHKDPFLEELALFLPQKIDLQAMQKATQLLLLYEDFESFCKVKANTPHFKCKITQAFWKIEKDTLTGQELLIFQISANRFLWGMVRAIVGTLLDVGKGKLQVNDFEQIIRARNRSQASAAAPACGLWLTAVKYPFLLKKAI